MRNLCVGVVYFVLILLQLVSCQTPTNLPPGNATPPQNGLQTNQTNPGGIIPCPGTEFYNDCFYPTTALNGQTWSCDAGFFCQTPDKKEICTSGFYCPKDAREPIYCPSKYNCPTTSTINRCPSGYYCPGGTKSAIPCLLWQCPKGTGSNIQPLVLIVFTGLFLVVLMIFNQKGQHDRTRAQIKAQRLYDICLNPTNDLNLGSDDDNGKSSRPRFQIEFTNMGLILPNGVEVLKGVSGQLKPGRLTAIMGPSGSGKTTFISLLMGKVRRTSGIVSINGRETEMSSYQKFLGYVPQEDIMLTELTVWDVLLHSARMRLPSSWTLKQIKKKVSETLAFLGLSKVLSSTIGNAESRGISGGQRKRVNIGIELVTDPSIMFLDEPTSGIDSTTSLDICRLLRSITHARNMITAAIIHSPSAASFEQFDDLLLLGKGGETVYFGPRQDALAFFNLCGFHARPGENPADFFMDITLGKVKSRLNNDLKPSELPRCWIKFCNGEPPAATPNDIGDVFVPGFKNIEDVVEEELNMQLKRQLRDESDTINESEMGSMLSRNFFKGIFTAVATLWHSFAWWITDVFMEIAGIFSCGNREDSVVSSRKSIGKLKMFFLLTKRATRQLMAKPTNFILEMLLHYVIGVLVSIGSNELDFLSRLPEEVCVSAPLTLQKMCRDNIDGIQQAGMSVCWGVVFAGTTASYSTFGAEKLVYWRDKSWGMPSLPYFVAKVFIDLFRMVLASLVFSAAFILFYPSRAPFYTLALVTFEAYLFAFALGYCVSLTFNKNVVPLVGTAVGVAWASLLSGVYPNLAIIYDKWPQLKFLYFISVPRWAVEAFWIKEISSRDFDLSKIKLPVGYDMSRYGIAVGFMTAISGVWLILAFLSLKLLNRDKQK